jgi:hypothetical protein
MDLAELHRSRRGVALVFVLSAAVAVAGILGRAQRWGFVTLMFGIFLMLTNGTRAAFLSYALWKRERSE